MFPLFLAHLVFWIVLLIGASTDLGFRRSAVFVSLWGGAICLFTLVTSSRLMAAPSRLEMCQSIALPGVEGRFDHFACDPTTQRLFVSAFANNSLEIVGLREGRRLQTISGIRKPTGVVYVSSLKRIGVATYDETDGTAAQAPTSGEAPLVPPKSW